MLTHTSLYSTPTSFSGWMVVRSISFSTWLIQWNRNSAWKHIQPMFHFRRTTAPVIPPKHTLYWISVWIYPLLPDKNKTSWRADPAKTLQMDQPHLQKKNPHHAANPHTEPSTQIWQQRAAQQTQVGLHWIVAAEPADTQDLHWCLGGGAKCVLI